MITLITLNLVQWDNSSHNKPGTEGLLPPKMFRLLVLVFGIGSVTPLIKDIVVQHTKFVTTLKNASNPKNEDKKNNTNLKNEDDIEIEGILENESNLKMNTI